MKKLLKMIHFAMMMMFVGWNAQAEIKNETVEYKEGKTVLEGQWVYDDAMVSRGVQPAVIIIHQWMGPTAYEQQRAQQLAELGYVAFVADIYGKGVRPSSTEEAGKLAGLYKGDVKLYRQRIKAAVDVVAKNKRVNSKKLAVMGYCFGGTGALEAARAGLPIVAAVSFHGGLSTPEPQKTKSIKPQLLVLHGALDPYVPAKEVEGFMAEMNGAKASYQFVSYSGAVHAFTQKMAGDDISKGAAYNEVADRRSWVALQDFLKEVF